MITVNSIRAKVLAKRLEIGLSQSEVARRAGVSRKWVSEFERGKAKAEFGLVMRLVDTLGLEMHLEDSAPAKELKAKQSTSAGVSVGRMHLSKVDLDQIARDYR